MHPSSLSVHPSSPKKRLGTWIVNRRGPAHSHVGIGALFWHCNVCASVLASEFKKGQQIARTFSQELCIIYLRASSRTAIIEEESVWRERIVISANLILGKSDISGQQSTSAILMTIHSYYVTDVYASDTIELL